MTLLNQLLELTVAQVQTHALVLLDPVGNIVGWLAGAERLFGYTVEEAIGKNFSILFTPEDLAKDLANWELNTAIAAGVSEDDRWHIRKDGGRIWVSGTLTSLRDEKTTLIGFAKIMRNQTDQKFQVETLESHIDALQNLEHRKNSFIATLAHELRGPLAALSNAAQLLETWQSESPDLTFTVGVVRRQVDFMSRMVDDLIDVTRAAIGKMVLQKERVVLQELIDASIETCLPYFDQRTQSLQRLLPAAPIYLDGDPTRLRQVFINLLQNAAKYTCFGGTIRIKASTEGDEAVIRVEDDGVGISPDVMPHIFELFTQSEFAVRSEEGLGIGLSVVKANVAAHGGTIQAASDGLGKGSEFTVRLPFRRER